MPSRSHRRKPNEPKLHKVADKMTEMLIYFMLVFSPWAFGTTEPWSIWIMNYAAFGLGALLITKWIIRFTTKYDIKLKNKKLNSIPKKSFLAYIHIICKIFLAGSIFILLAYILTSGVNALGSFNVETKEYTYFEKVNKSLPYSYDAQGTWNLFWQYLGLTIVFWATKDWFAGAKLLYLPCYINPRIRRLLIFFCFNGGLVALQCILQRIYYDVNLGKLLFVIEPNINSDNISQFGPFAYRSNAATYLNIIWPISVGLFIQIGRENLEYGKRRVGSGPELLLIPCIVLAASGPIISTSRGGALVAIMLQVIIVLSIFFNNLKNIFLRSAIFISILIGIISAYVFGWEFINNRFENIFLDNMSGRKSIWEATIKMINEYGIYGSGPGSFQAIVQFEFNDTFKYWDSWAHNDYLEFYLTFGKIGSIILLIIFLCTFIILLINLISNQYKNITWFVHAIGDFPLQTYNVLISITFILVIAFEIGSSKFITNDLI